MQLTGEVRKEPALARLGRPVCKEDVFGNRLFEQGEGDVTKRTFRTTLLRDHADGLRFRPALAQTAPDAGDPDASAADAGGDANAIVVTATRRATT
jgi:hypothetical protein